MRLSPKTQTRLCATTTALRGPFRPERDCQEKAALSLFANFPISVRILRIITVSSLFKLGSGVTWGPVVPTTNPAFGSSVAILGLGGEGYYLSFFAVFKSTEGVPGARLIARLAHGIADAFILSIAFSNFDGDHCGVLAIGASNGALKEFRVRFSVTDEKIAIIVDGEREVRSFIFTYEEFCLNILSPLGE
jgi:hypothetical protein